MRVIKWALFAVCAATSLATAVNLVPSNKVVEYTISVSLKEGGGSPIEDADLALAGPEGVGGVASLIKLERKTDGNGRAEFKVTRPGNYTITAKKFRYKEETKKIVVADSAEPIVVEMSLRTAIARLLVKVMDYDSNDPVVGASVITTRGDKMILDRMTTDEFGVAYVLIEAGKVTQGETNFTVTVSHRDYEQESRLASADPNTIKDSFVPFLLTRKEGLKVIRIECLESGDRAAIMGASIKLDGGQENYHSSTTDPYGRAVFRVKGGTIYRLTITSDRYESVTDTIDLVGADSPKVVPKTYVMERKADGKEMRRALMVRVRYKDKDGSFKPVIGATMTGIGLSTFVTDSNGNVMFFHTVPPGETITIGATKMSFEPAKGDVIVRDKGVMVDMQKFSRDTTKGGMTDIEAFRNQGVSAVDLLVITMKSEKLFTPKISGDVVPSKGQVKINERIDIAVSLFYEESDEEQIDIKETVELFGPDGKVVQNNYGTRTLKLNENSRRNFAITCEQAGTYTLRSTVTGPDGLKFTDEAKFTVIAVAIPPKPGQGYFKLLNKVVGKAPEPGTDSNGTVSGTITEGSLTIQYRGAAGRDATADISANWSMPPTTLKQGEIIDLTAQGKASVKGKDRGSVGIGIDWGVIGSVEVLEGKKAFIGLASNGIEYESGNVKYRVKIGSGGSITLIAAQGGWAWGSGGIWNPCEYHYVWVAGEAPTTNTSNKATINAGQATSIPDESMLSRVGLYEAVDVLIPFGSSNEPHTLRLRFSAGTNPKVLTMTGTLTPQGSLGYRMTFSGTYYYSTNKFSGTGKVATGTKGKWDIKLDGTSYMKGYVHAQIHIVSIDQKVNRHLDVRVERRF